MKPRSYILLVTFVFFTLMLLLFQLHPTGAKAYSVVIDPGHGGSDNGASGPSGIKEKDVNLDVALRVKALLEQSGVTVHMTRTSDTYPSLSERVDLANNQNVDRFISIHHNASGNQSINGSEVWIYANASASSQALASDVLNELTTALELPNRGVKQASNFYVLKNTNMPAILTEASFISNPQEEQKLANPEYQAREAQAIANGVIDHLRSTISITGRGHGHGVGMSMAGVYGMANNGTSCQNIVNHYYTNVNWESRDDNSVVSVQCTDGQRRPYTVREYLYRLAEEPDDWPREGLRTLMVAARTYLWYKVDTYGYMPGGQAFNHNIDPSSRPNTVAAVNDTSGQILTYGGQPIVAAYSSNSGGYTAAFEDVWGGDGYPYLQRVPSPEDSAVSNSFRWNASLHPSTIEATYPQIGSFTSIEIPSRNGVGEWGGRVLQVKINGDGGSVTVSGNEFRSAFGLRSSWFAIELPSIRLYGETSHGTAVAISQSVWGSCKLALLARADHFSDALAGVPLAYTYVHDQYVNTPVPILLTNPAVMSPESMAEIRRLGVEKVIVLGGLGAISPEVVAELQANGIVCERIWQATGYGTAADIATRMRMNAHANGTPPPDTAIITTGENFPDALTVSSPAAARNMPILLVKPTHLPDETVQALEQLQIRNLIIVGGAGAVHPDVEQALRDRGFNVLARLWGNTQYETATAIVAQGNPLFEFTYPGAVFVARGDWFTDALAGGALASRMNPAPIVLTETYNLPETTHSYLSGRSNDITKVYILGGPGAISEAVAGIINTL